MQTNSSLFHLLRDLLDSVKKHFQANILVVFEIPHPFPLNTHFGALAAGLGSFPFDCPTYLVQSDSHTTSTRH